MSYAWSRGKASAGLAVAVAALALAVAACGSSSSGGAAEDGGNKQVTLTVASFSWPPLEKRGQAIVDAWITPFEKAHPNIKIKLQGVPFASYDQTIGTQLGTSSAPDVAELTPPGFFQAASNGALAKLDGLVDDSTFKDKLYPVNETGLVNGSRFGYVYSVQLFGMFYNKKLLDAKGIQVPTTFEELLSAAKQLTDKKTGTYGFAMRSTLAEEAGWLPQFMIWALGNGVSLSDGNGKPTIDTPQMRTAVDQYMQMYKSGAMLTGATAATYRQAFAAGKIGFIFDNGLGILQGSFPTLNGLAYAAPSPLPNPRQQTSPLFVAVAERSEHKKEAAQLVQYLFSPEVQARMSVALSGELPSAFDFDQPSPEYKAYQEKAYWIGPLESKAKDGATYLPNDKVANFVPQIGNTILTELSKVQAGQESVDDMLKNAQAEAEKVVG